MATKLPSPPKKPKESAPVSSWENYDKRHKEWASKCAKIKAGHKKKEALIKKHRR